MRTQALILTLVAAMLVGTATKVPLPDAAKRVAELVVAKAAGKSVAVVVRPEAARYMETPTHVAALRAAVAQALAAADVKVPDATEADRTLRETVAVGLPAAPVARAAVAAAQADVLLCLLVRKAGDVDAFTAYVLADGRPLGQLAITVDPKTLVQVDSPVDGSPGDLTDVAQAAVSIGADVAPAVTKVTADATAKQIARVLLSVRPESPADAGTAGFEQGLYDAVAKGFTDASLTVAPLSTVLGKSSAVRPIGPVLPVAIAKLKDFPTDGAVLTATYARRPGGRVVKLSLVTGAKQLATASAAVDEWDGAAFPLYPVLNTRVLAFSEAQVGKKVGNGECWTLAADALTDAKARGANGYTFGRKLAPGETPYPGDIFQFTSAKFEGHTGNFTWWKTLGEPNHTAVLRRVLGPNKFEILEQNPGPVKTDTIDFKDLKSGTWELWRPVQ